MTPLTRQVMTKSIHRAILEYQETHNVGISSPKSPLDLRVRKIHISDRENGLFDRHNIDKSIKISNHHEISAKTVTRFGSLETVYEQEKTNFIKSNNEIAANNDNQVLAIEPTAHDPIAETPVSLLRKSSTVYIGEADEDFDNDIWYTPKEFTQSNVIENIEVI